MSSRAARESRPWLGWLLGVLVVVSLGAGVWSDTLPDGHDPLQLVVTFPRGTAGGNEPLVTTGVTGRGDFLTVKYVSATSAVLSYDSWGKGGPESAPFELNPGKPHQLKVDLPALAQRSEPMRGERRELSVELDGREVLRGAVTYHGRRADELYVAVNPIGGSPAPFFSGKIATTSGWRLRGRPAALYSVSARIAAILRTKTWQVTAILFAGLAAGVIARRLPVRRWIPAVRAMAPRAFEGETAAPHVTFAVAAALCTAVFTTLITGGTFKLLYPESFGSFYDHQAASLLQGRLDVPEAALSGEAFIVQGKCYGYFGLTPAMLRLPFAVAHLGFAELSRPYMIADYVACLVASYFLLCWATRRLAGPRAWPSRGAVLVLVGGAGLGSTLLFLGSRAYIYHEAILSGAAFALWSAYFSLRYFEAPGGRWWMASGFAGLLAVHARPPAGLFSLFLLGCVAAYHGFQWWWARDRGRLAPHVLAALCATAAMASFSGVSYLKFGTFDGSPLRYSVQYTPERVARFEGKNFHASNLRHNFDTYVVDPGFHLERRFPYVRFGSDRPRTYPEAKIDLEEPTIAMPYAMSGLFLLASVGALWTIVVAGALRRVVLLLVLGVAPMALALATAIVTSHRYTGDFCAALIALSACAMATVDCGVAHGRRGALIAVAIVTVLGAGVTLGASLHFQGEVVWGVAPEARHNYEQVRKSADNFLGAARP